MNAIREAQLAQRADRLTEAIHELAKADDMPAWAKARIRRALDDAGEPVGRLTPRQADVLRFVVDFHAAHDYGPTYGEIADHLGVSRAVAFEHTKELERKRYVRRVGHTSRSLEPLWGPSDAS